MATNYKIIEDIFEFSGYDKNKECNDYYQYIFESIDNDKVRRALILTEKGELTVNTAGKFSKTEISIKLSIKDSTYHVISKFTIEVLDEESDFCIA